MAVQLHNKNKEFNNDILNMSYKINNVPFFDRLICVNRFRIKYIDA